MGKRKLAWNGKISFSDFTSAVVNINLEDAHTRKRLDAIFNQFDMDNSELIT